MCERKLSPGDMFALKEWVDHSPLVPDGDWYKDFGTFKLCGTGSTPKTFLGADQAAWGEKIDD